MDEDLIRAAYENNPDGFGVMMPTGQGRIHVHKLMPDTYEDCMNVYKMYQGKPIALHFRLATHGDSDKANCHPFQVLNLKEHGRDCWLMHNGPTIDAPSFDTAKSDTWHFVEYILRPILAREPNLLETDILESILENLADKDRLTILDGKTEAFITTNFNTTDETDGLLLSNQYSLRRGKGVEYDIHTGVTSWRDSTNWDNNPYGRNVYDPYSNNIYPKVATKIVDDMDLPELMDVFQDIIRAMDTQNMADDNPVRLEIASLIEIDNNTEEIPEKITSFPAIAPPLIIDAEVRPAIHDIQQLTEAELYNWAVKNPEEVCDILKEIL